MSISRKLPAFLLGLQGGLVILAGLYGLAKPVDFISQGLGVQGLTSSAIGQLAHASSLQLITMGVYFVLAARHPPMHRQALTINVGLRLLAGYLFWQDGPRVRSVALWEILWAGINGATAYLVK